jgi:DnaJ-domain-containing protein 1
MATDYKQMYLNAQAQSDKNFNRYEYRKSQEQKFKNLHAFEKKRADDLLINNKALLQQIQTLKNAQSSNTNNSGARASAKSSITPDNRNAMEVLGLSVGFTPQDLKDAYKRLTNRYHPDKHIHMSQEFKNEAEIEFGKIQKAYNKIK